ncbi:hypothetical protein J437_LFUL007863 [Ladona fulva]|uniref:glutathione transferase n=1 Tax=Ladona fulva TaxID=123851 RepID=A0A8K0JXQ5_LADFU|nr:hypothetical protein J437_LFUL007863 [Ladona fulva]
MAGETGDGNKHIETNSAMSPKYKLTYFDLRGLAEPLRFLLAYGDIEYEDSRFTFEQWPEMKKSMPFGKVPVLEVDGQALHQSMAMTRYFAKQLKLTGDDDWEAMLCDIMVDTMNDFRMQVTGYYYEPNEETKEKKKEVLFNETMPFYLERLDEEVKKNDGHFVKGKLTWADLAIVAMIDFMEDQLQTKFTDNYSNLKAIKEKVLDLPQIKAWVERRPKTNY